MELATFGTSDWRLLHVLSHHMFTNTYNDYETQGVFPMVDFNVHSHKGLARRRFQQLVSIHVRRSSRAILNTSTCIICNKRLTQAAILFFS